MVALSRYNMYHDDTARKIVLFFFFFNDTATTEIYTLSLHDALPIWSVGHDPDDRRAFGQPLAEERGRQQVAGRRDRKSTRLNSSHSQISYAAFCLKKKNSSNVPSVHHMHSTCLQFLGACTVDP